MSKFAALLFVLVACAAPAASAAENGDDWLESYNRAVFDFNMQLDKYTLKPLAKGYRAITTPDIRSRVTSFVFNVREPLSAVNHTLQGNVKQALVSVGRLLINTTLGLGGLFDVAAGWGLERSTTGFDDTMAYYCIPDGPFFVAPFLGPITPRALAAYTADSFASPMYWGPLNDKNYADKISYSYAALVAINARERSLDLLDDLQKNSVDFYSTARSAYIQNRQKMNGRSLCGSDADPASYDFDFDMDEEFEYE